MAARMEPVIVIDNGSGVCKAGFGGDQSPRSVFHSIVGKRNALLEGNPDEHDTTGLDAKKSYYVGEEALEHKHDLTLHYPIKHGIVQNWDEMLRVFEYLFESDLRAKAKDRTVLLTEAPLDPKANRDKMSEIMFEHFGVESLYVECPAKLCLYSLGLTNGLVLDCGDGVTHTVPIYQGYESPHAVIRADMGGSDVTEYLSRIMTERGYYLNFTTESREIVREIKEKLSFVALDYCSEMKTVPSCSQHRLSHKMNAWAKDGSFTLPDGKTITIGSERFRCAEILFQPSLIGKEILPIHECVRQSIVRCDDQYIQRSLFSSIYIFGGTTSTPGFAERLGHELRQVLPEHMPVDITAPPERKYSVWIGGSVFASHSSFRSMCVTRAEYEEWGPCILHDRCPHS
jgi:actin